MAAAAGRTKRIRLTPAVVILSSDDPVRVFQDYATLDLVSKARAELLVGRGSFIESFPLFGYSLSDYDERAAFVADLADTAARRWRQGFRPARFYFFAWLAFIVGANLAAAAQGPILDVANRLLPYTGVDTVATVKQDGARAVAVVFAAEEASNALRGRLGSMSRAIGTVLVGTPASIKGSLNLSAPGASRRQICASTPAPLRRGRSVSRCLSEPLRPAAFWKWRTRTLSMRVPRPGPTPYPTEVGAGRHQAERTSLLERVSDSTARSEQLGPGLQFPSEASRVPCILHTRPETGPQLDTLSATATSLS